MAGVGGAGVLVLMVMGPLLVKVVGPSAAAGVANSRPAAPIANAASAAPVVLPTRDRRDLGDNPVSTIRPPYSWAAWVCQRDFAQYWGFRHRVQGPGARDHALVTSAGVGLRRSRRQSAASLVSGT